LRRKRLLARPDGQQQSDGERVTWFKSHVLHPLYMPPRNSTPNAGAANVEIN
jgi:hypothetical protein